MCPFSSVLPPTVSFLLCPPSSPPTPRHGASFCTSTGSRPRPGQEPKCVTLQQDFRIQRPLPRQEPKCVTLQQDLCIQGPLPGQEPKCVTLQKDLCIQGPLPGQQPQRRASAENQGEGDGRGWEREKERERRGREGRRGRREFTHHDLTHLTLKKPGSASAAAATRER